MKNNTSVKSILVLVSICLFISVAMAAINMVTAPKIASAQERAQQDALSEVLPENGGFDKLELQDLPECVTEVYRDLDGQGIVMLLSVKGYDSSNPMSVAVGYTNDGIIENCHIISANGETSGIGSKVTQPAFYGQFSGKDSGLENVDAISGATVSSGALIEAVKQSFSVFELIEEVEG